MPEEDPATIRKLVDDCRQRLSGELCDLLEELGPKLIEEALVLSRDVRDAKKRGIGLGLSQALRERWHELPPRLKDALARNAAQAARVGLGSLDLAGLHVLSDDEQAAQLAMREVTERVGTACGDETGPLERRIAHLVLKNALPRGDHSFRVDSVCTCVETACTQVVPDAAQRTALLQLLGAHLASELPQIYRAINEAMVDAEILPKLRRSYSDDAPVDPGTAAAESARMMSRIEQMAKKRTAAAGAEPARDSGAASQAIFSSLKLMEKPAEPSGTMVAGFTNVVRLARDSEAAREVRPMEAVTLDIVAELFDIIFGDKQVSDGIKWLASGLQGAVLKVAMQNQQFFSDRTHPARRFLDSIASIAIRWGAVVDAKDPFYRKLSELVDRIQRNYDGDVGIFDAANGELSNFLAEREKIEAEENRVLAEAIKAREEEMRRQREAQIRAQRVADQALAPLRKQDMPISLEQFLFSYWRDVLQGRIHASGAESAPAVEALVVAADLVASVAPKHTAEDKQRQVAALPALLKKINAGLDELGVSASERAAFMDALIELQLAALKADKRAAPKAAAPVAPAPAARAAPTLQVSHATDRGVRVQDISLPGDAALDPLHAPDREHLRHVRQLVRGDWVEFIGAGQTRRERLTWINPSRTLFLFSNSASECAISITPEALAVRLKNQTARLVKRDTRFFERALHGAVQSVDARAA